MATSQPSHPVSPYSKNEPVELITYDSHGALWLVRLMRNEGERIPRFVWAAGETDPPIGRLTVKLENEGRYFRQLLVARLRHGSKDLVGPLRDARIVALDHEALTITGFETIGERDYAQTWFCRIAVKGWLGRGRPDEGVGAPD